MSRRRSLTITKRPQMLDEEGQPEILEQDVVKNVKIYLRRANKSTKVASIPSQATATQISVLVEKELGIPRNSQVLFFKGTQIDLPTGNSPSEKVLHFSDKDILHVHMSPTQSQIRVKLEYLSPSNHKTREVPCLINTSESIEAALSRAMIESIEVVRSHSFIQSGRRLVISKKANEEFLQDSSVITVLSGNRQQKSAAEETTKNAPIQTQKNEEKVEIGVGVKEQLRVEASQGSPDFKKKNRVMCLSRSQLRAEGKQLIWESDSSTEFNKRALITNLYRKKTVKEEKIDMQIKSNSSGGSANSGPSKFTLTDKKQLKQEFKKLFQSDCLHNQSQIKKLQPPAFSSDDCFIEEVEEIEINGETDMDCLSQSDSDSDSQEDKDRCDGKQNGQTYLGSSKSLFSSLPLDLRKSIGKIKGTFMPIPLIPTRDFDDDEMEI